jgi:hypothetical protein
MTIKNDHSRCQPWTASMPRLMAAAAEEITLMASTGRRDAKLFVGRSAPFQEQRRPKWARPRRHWPVVWEGYSGETVAYFDLAIADHRLMATRLIR